MTPAPDATPVMRVRGLRRHYPVSDGMFRQKQMLRAVEGINFDLHAGETLAVVGESGSGKSTLGRLCALIEEFADAPRAAAAPPHDETLRACDCDGYEW